MHRSWQSTKQYIPNGLINGTTTQTLGVVASKPFFFYWSLRPKSLHFRLQSDALSEYLH